ncbi:hypothetical protein FJ977_10570 [Mesorhizobium sp. B2-1-3A]|nr:hypothetical protein FJ977_10570 [Mesorhizobium sp. B2-1-3A]
MIVACSSLAKSPGCSASLTKPACGATCSPTRRKRAKSP